MYTGTSVNILRA